MKSKDVQVITGLTRKAIEYYEMLGLVNPSRDENGYRNYREEDVSRLLVISGYRKLGLSLSEITAVLSSDNLGETIANIVREKEIQKKIDEKRLSLLSLMANGSSFSDIQDDLETLESQESIYIRLTNKFPGYIGQMLFVNYAPFLQGRLESSDQKDALNELIDFLDQMEDLPFTEDEIRVIQEASEEITIEQMEDIAESKMHAVHDTEKWMQENEDAIRNYQELKDSKEYQSLPIMQLMKKLQEFLMASGYYEVVIPLLRRMSPSYDDYYRQLIQSNEYFVKDLGEN